MKCDGCGRMLNAEEPVMEVAISLTSAGEVDAKVNEWDPRLKGFVCRECVTTKTLKEIMERSQ